MVGKQGDETMKMLDTLSPQSESRQRWLLVFTSLLFIQSETPAWAPTFRGSPPIPDVCHLGESKSSQIDNDVN